jgi:ribosome maturation factor RimP
VRCWLAGGTEVRGRLAEVGGERLILEQGGERVEVSRADVTKARLDAEVPWPRRSL